MIEWDDGLVGMVFGLMTGGIGGMAAIVALKIAFGG
jgi:hypothetical protein